MRLGLLGGTFDPVHYGHLLLAECCREQCGLDAVWFVPAATPPHKQGQWLSGAEHRVEMLKLAIAGHEPFGVSTREIERGGVSYTVDTLESLVAEDPSRKLFLLLGGDSLVDLPTWRQPERICQLALPVIVRRPGAPEPDFRPLAALVSGRRLAEIQAAQVEMPQIELSSREIRRRVTQGLSIRFRTPRAVEMYIRSAGLYRQAEDTAGGGGAC